MLLVKTTIGPSKIHGLGLFAAERIPKGTYVWKFMPDLDIVKTKNEVNTLQPVIQDLFIRRAYLDSHKQKYVLSPDGSMFVNHSVHSNLVQDFSADPYGPEIAARDIEAGEELTENYRDYDDPSDFKKKMSLF